MKNSPSTRPNMVVRQHRDPYHEDYNRFFGASEHEGEIIPWKAPDKISRMRGEIITPSYPLHDPSIANKTFLPNLRQNPCRHPGEQSPNPEDEERMFHGIMARVQSFVVAMLDESNPNSMLFLGEDSALDKPDKNDLLKSIIADFKKTSFSHITPRIKRVDPILDNGMPFIDEHGRPDNTHFYEISSYNWLVGGPLLEYREHPDPRKHINLYEGRNLTYGDLDRSLQPDLAFSSEKLVKIGPQYVDKNEELNRNRRGPARNPDPSKRTKALTASEQKEVLQRIENYADHIQSGWHSSHSTQLLAKDTALRESLNAGELDCPDLLKVMHRTFEERDLKYWIDKITPLQDGKKSIDASEAYFYYRIQAVLNEPPSTGNRVKTWLVDLWKKRLRKNNVHILLQEQDLRDAGVISDKDVV